MKSFLKFFKSKKKLALLLIAFSVLAEIIGAIIFEKQNKDESHFTETLYYCSQFVSSIFVISGVVIAVWQYYLSSKSTKSNLEIIQIQRAIDLSAYYKDNILKYFPAIRYIFREAKINDILANIKIEDMKYFNKAELAKLFTLEQIETLKSIEKSDNFAAAILKANIIYGLNFPFSSLPTASEMEELCKKPVDIDQTTLLSAFMANLICTTLNNLEFFASHFSHNTADESVVYQSLHQTYLDNMPYLYYYIAKLNEEPSKKLYTNVIWLFDKWKSREEQQRKQRSKNDEAILSHGNTIL